MNETIELTDIGPVETLSIPIPEEGGVVVLRGANGTGKSSALRAVDRLATGKKEIPVSARDGAARGQISGCGVTLRVARSITRTGELEVESLDGRLSVADLVDPGLKGAEEADNRRIKALVQLSGVKPDVDLFHSLFENPSDFDAVTKGKNLETDDILILADRIKRAIEEAARLAEGDANQQSAEAAACREAASSIDTSVETDEAENQINLEIAVRVHQEKISGFQEAERHNSNFAQARQRIEEAKQNASGLSVSETRENLSTAENNLQNSVSEVSRLRAELAQAEINQQHALEIKSHWVERLREAERSAEALSGLKEIVEAGEISGPTKEEIEQSEKDVLAARQRIEAGALARRALDHLAKEKEHLDLRDASTSLAESLRGAARRVDDVLSEQIAKLGVPLQVRAGRLISTDHKRGATLFAELSDGERWRIALDIAIEAVGENGLLSIPQTAYEGLDPTNRRMIAEHVKGRGVVILTAEATDGDLRAEIDE